MVDAAIIKKTQESLGKIIKKPPLTEKLLSKPPFRYLHDIISEVTKTTGFLEGLFEDSEKSSAAIKDKDGKIAYLQKAIDAVGLIIGSPLSARPSKIIAGQEPEKTNEFLQLLGKCAAKGADNEVVKKVKKGEKPSKKSESSRDKKERKTKEDPSKGKSKERDSSKGRSKREQSSSKERSSKERVSGSSKERGSKERPERGRRERREEKAEEPKKERSADRSERKKEEKKEPEKQENDEKREKEERREREKEERREREKEERREREKEERRRKKEEEEQAAAAAAASAAETEAEPPQQPEGDNDTEASLTNGFHDTDEAAPARIPRPSSAKGARRRPDPAAAAAGPSSGEEQKPTYAEAVAGATTADPPVPIVAGKRRERPTSARPAPPRIKKKDDEPEEMNVREGSGRPTVGIIVDNDDNNAAEDEEMFVNEATEESLPVKQPVIMSSGGQHGGLVQKIIDSQKQYTGPEKQDSAKAPAMNQAARQKERNLVKKEIDQLRVGIQTLASSAAPLGKVLDYLQEDLDSMQKELENWRAENRYHDTAIKAEESHMEKTLEPLKDQLTETEQQILDQISRINSMKCNIYNNDQKIEQMLSTMSFSTS